MNSTKASAIFLLALGFMVCPPPPTQAAPIGAMFTYQGRLMDANIAADDLYDFEFKLYDDPNVILGNQLGATINVNEIDVIDGYFTVQLDFGSEIFDGEDRWLEIGVRPGLLDDPNVYTTLMPRQYITPVPYALQTRGIFVDNDGRVGIGTTEPDYALHVANRNSVGLVLERSDTGGQQVISFRNPLQEWMCGLRSNEGFLVRDVTNANNAFVLMAGSGNVGIATEHPASRLEVAGTVHSTSGGFKFPDGTLQATAATGITPTDITNWNSAYSWGDHALAGYLTAEMDPVYTGSAAAGIAAGDITNWNAAFGWGNHLAQGYLTSESDPKVGSNTTNYIPRWNGSALVSGTIYDNGNVGIGTTNPEAKLEVADGPIKAAGGLIIEIRIDDPCDPATGQMWLRSDL